VAEGTRLLSEYGAEHSIAGSNPALSVFGRLVTVVRTPLNVEWHLRDHGCRQLDEGDNHTRWAGLLKKG
jgi:hypothetical protein